MCALRWCFVMKKIGFIGWRGMVGSVLMDRMKREGDFQGFASSFFTTSQVGAMGPDIQGSSAPLLDAHDFPALMEHDILVSCQGGEYTTHVHPELRLRGWRGYWIDAASTLRMADDSVLILDPVNRPVIDRALAAGVRDFVGPNCTVSLMLMGMIGLIREGLVEWITSMTYQSASGAGAKHMRELVSQMADISGLLASAPDALSLADQVHERLRSASFPTQEFGAPLAASLIPWIDRAMENGQTREEWKGGAEAARILGADHAIPVDGQCVRVGALRCHSQALTIKLRKNVPLDEIERLIRAGNEWVRWVPNTKEETLRHLTPAAISGSLDIAVGRVRKMTLGPEYLTAFTVGDQLLWGAAEPLRRMIGILLGRV